MPELLSFVKVALSGISAREVAIAPQIDPKRLKGAAEFAAFGGETPLVLLDDTVFQSGKKGVLLTSAAVYFHTPRVRVPIEHVRAPPVEPAGDDLPLMLVTPGGEIALPEMVQPELDDALFELLDALARWNRGDTEITAGELPAPGPIGELALRELTHAEVDLAPNLPLDALNLAAARAGMWADYAAGEDVLAFIEEGDDGSDWLALTDRRLIGQLYGQRIDVWYASVAAVEPLGGVLGRGFRLHLQGGAPIDVKLSGASGAAAPVGAFLHALVTTIPPHARRAAPPPGPSADDPSGAGAIARAFVRRDPRVDLLLRLVYQATARGWMAPPAGADVVARVAILQRTLASGRAVRSGFALAALPTADVLYALAAVLGPATPRGHDGSAWVYEFDVRRGGELKRAAVDSAAGLALLAVTGVGWVTLPGSSLLAVQLRILDANGAAMFSVHAQGAALAAIAPDPYDAMVSALAQAEAQMLLYRCAYGWSAPMEQLMAQPRVALHERVSQVLGPVDLSAFEPVAPGR